MPSGDAVWIDLTALVVCAVVVCVLTAAAACVTAFIAVRELGRRSRDDGAVIAKALEDMTDRAMVYTDQGMELARMRETTSEAAARSRARAAAPTIPMSPVGGEMFPVGREPDVGGVGDS
jgi:hypothetical protein